MTNTTRVAMITGASRGLGRTLAHFLAGQGTNLILTARGDGALQGVAAEVRALGVEVWAEAGDVRDDAHRQRLVSAAKAFGRLDLLVNNASLLGPSPQPVLSEYPLPTLAEVFDANVLAPIGFVQAALPQLQASAGLVVNISSDAAVGGYEGWGGYGSSKAALDLVSVTLANELRDTGIAVVSVDPGDMRTDMHQAAFPDEDISDRPLPDVTIPFWAWLVGHINDGSALSISGQRFQAQGEQWSG